jgi:aspartokinase/homoserine dehydrogenase 1
VASYYEEWMRQGIHVITPNKRANSGPFEYWARLRELGRKSYTHYFYEATVGAGLPIISTLSSLRDSGDRITRIEGVFSGTLSYIFNTFAAGGAPFSTVVAEAKRLGYTEPDPRDDLSGTDVARKVVILAREAGLRLELADVPVQSLVPLPLQSAASGEEYMRRLPEHDADMAALIADADAAGEVLRYVGIVDPGPAGSRVELRRYPKAHPFASLSGSDNMMSFTTKRCARACAAGRARAHVCALADALLLPCACASRSALPARSYSTQPLIVRGPGAGAEVTAGGVFADLLRLAAYLGAPS